MIAILAFSRCCLRAPKTTAIIITATTTPPIIIYFFFELIFLPDFSSGDILRLLVSDDILKFCFLFTFDIVDTRPPQAICPTCCAFEKYAHFFFENSAIHELTRGYVRRNVMYHSHHRNVRDNVSYSLM